MSEKFKRLAKSLPSLYKAESNVMIRGLLNAWAIGDDNVEIQITNAKDQLFIQTASDQYLDRLANNVGVSRTPELGIEDADFRNLVPVLSTYPKQVRKTLVSLLDVFWGPGFTRPNINSGNVESYNLGPIVGISGTLIFTNGVKEVKGTGTSFTTQVSAGQYIKPTSKASKQFAKVSAVIDDNTLVLSEAWSNDTAVNLSSCVADVPELEYEIDNGRDRRAIRFKPNAFQDLTAVTVQELVNFINTNSEHNTQITASVFLDPLAGNKLNLRTNTAGLQASIQVIGGSANAPSKLNFPQTKATEVKAAVYELSPNEVVIKIPSSVPILRRNLSGASHPRQTKAQIFSTEEVYDFSILGLSSTLVLTVDGLQFTVNYNHVADFANPEAATNEEVCLVINRQILSLEAFAFSPSGSKTIGLQTRDGATEYQIIGGTANAVLQFPTTLQADPDIIDTGFPSAYIFDPTGQLFTVTGISTELSSQVEIGTIRDFLTVANASSFPNKPGKLLINFGRSGQEGPVSYNSRPNNSTLLIDAGYVFENEHLPGRKVNYVSDTPTIPRLTGDDYPVYIVGTEESRSAAQALIKKLLAAGVVIRFIIEFPEYLFECTCRDCGPSEDPNFVGTRSGLSPLVF